MEKIKAFVFDLDGTLYLGDKVIDGALEMLLALDDKDYWIFYLTNNSGKARWQISRKVLDMGFPQGFAHTYSVSYAMSRYLIGNKIGPVYVIGSDRLKSDLEFYHIGVIGSPEVAAVVVGLDLGLNYEKITTALHAINNGAQLIVANIDPNYPAADGKILPGCGAMVGAIVGATGHQPDFHIGKPNTYMLELICKEHGLSAAEICVVGDVPELDIAMANNFGCQSILFDPEDAHKQFSGVKVENLREIIQLVK